MSKTEADFTIYPKSRGMFGPQYDMPGGIHMLVREGADVISQRKRLRGPELAAEYWRLRLKVCASGNRDMKAKGHVCAEWQAAHDELDTMKRFMELPHYDETTGQTAHQEGTR